MDRTIDYYEKYAESFADGTVDVEFADVQNKFISLLPEKGFILDFGCGSGRDTKYFIGKGFRVDAVDGSESLCQIAARNTGIPVRHMFFWELDVDAIYDGIWACSSILHLPKDVLRDVLYKMMRAVKIGGFIYTSFKYGEFEGYRNERYFIDFTEKSLEEFIRTIPEIEIVEEWVSADARPGRSDEKWLNLILRKDHIESL